MGDFPPAPRATVKASELVHRAVDRSYEDLRALVHQLPGVREEERREPLVQQLQAARARFAQLLAVLKWSVQAPLLAQCGELLGQAENYRDQVNETHDRLFFMHADLNRAKERRYDLSTAVDVLYGGSYLRFPEIAKHAMLARELPTVDVREAAREVDDLIRFRLIEAEIPEQFSSIDLRDGFVTCQAAGEFEIVLTIQGKEADSLWRVVSVNTALTDDAAFEQHSQAASTNALRIMHSTAPTPAHYNHLKNLVQRTMNKSDTPFVDAFKVMREFCSSLALQMLFLQGKLLMEGRWKNRILVKYHRDHNVLDLCYWPRACARNESGVDTMTDQQRLLAQLAESGDAAGSTLPPYPDSSLCVRLSSDPTQSKLLSINLSPSLPPNLPHRAALLDHLMIPSNLFEISAENLLVAAMNAHVAASLFSLGRLLIVDSPDEKKTQTQLISGENVTLLCSNSSLRISRSDIGGLKHFLEVSFDIREGRFVANCLAAAKNASVQASISQLERVLNTQCKIEVAAPSSRSGKIAIDFALISGDGKAERATEIIHVAVRKALCEIAVHEMTLIGSSFKKIEVLRNVSLNWERYIMFRQQHGAQTEDFSISESALYFQLTTSKESTCYLVVEIDKYSEPEGMGNSAANLHDSEMDEYVRLPCFSLLQTSAGIGNQAAGVQFIQRFSAFKHEDLHASVNRRNELTLSGLHSSTKKRSYRDASSDSRPAKRHLLGNEGFGFEDISRRSYSRKTSSAPHIATVLLHVINMCSERIQLQHFVNFARRRKSRIRYSGEAGTSGGPGTGGQVVTLSFPEKVNVEPLKILAIQGHLRHKEGFELSLQLAHPPFTFIAAKDPKQHLLSERSHHVNSRGQLIFKYPNAVFASDVMSENPLEIFMVELVCVVKPLCELAVKLEKIMAAAGRYTNDIKEDGHFYVESADPFAIVLACCAKNPRTCVAAGSTPDGKITYRVTIQFKQKMGFVVNYSHKAEHPLMHFIQSSLNGHNDPAQLLEALERTCIPMGILASVVESQLLCAKYYRHDPIKDEAGPSKSFGGGMGGKKGGKGMKLGYKFKLPGEDKGYYAEKSYGGDDKSFVAAELVLIPRSQTQVRLSYGDRCDVDIYFLEVWTASAHLWMGWDSN